MGQRVLRGSTATLETYPPVFAQASAATARVRTPTFELPDDGVAAAVDSLSTTIDADADAGEVSLTVASATWVRGRRYVATSTIDERVVLLAGTSGADTTLSLQEPLPTQLQATSTIKGMRISLALTAPQTAELSEACVVEWTATLDGVEHTWSDDFAIVERNQTYLLDSVKLTQSSPFCRRMQSDADADFSEMIEAAWSRYVELPLLAKGIKPDLIISRSELVPVHIAACEHFAAQSSLDIEQATRDEKKEELNSALSMVLNSTSLWIDDTSQALTPPEPTKVRLYNTTIVSR